MSICILLLQVLLAVLMLVVCTHRVTVVAMGLVDLMWVWNTSNSTTNFLFGIPEFIWILHLGRLVGVHILRFTPRAAIWVAAVVATMEVAVPVHITKVRNQIFPPFPKFVSSCLNYLYRPSSLSHMHTSWCYCWGWEMFPLVYQRCGKSRTINYFNYTDLASPRLCGTDLAS